MQNMSQNHKPSTPQKIQPLKKDSNVILNILFILLIGHLKVSIRYFNLHLDHRCIIIRCEHLIGLFHVDAGYTREGGESIDLLSICLPLYLFICPPIS
jgi:hypothetical protein